MPRTQAVDVYDVRRGLVVSVGYYRDVHGPDEVGEDRVVPPHALHACRTDQVRSLCGSFVAPRGILRAPGVI